jgi:hypothetical protein
MIAATRLWKFVGDGMIHLRHTASWVIPHCEALFCTAERFARLTVFSRRWMIPFLDLYVCSLRATR